MFNLRHSSLRNVIERIFGVLKKRFPILVVMSSYEFEFQCDLVYGAMMVHNFIRMNQLLDDEFDEWVDVEVVQNEDEEELFIGNQNALNNWRDGIASSMWEAYQLELAARNLL